MAQKKNNEILIPDTKAHVKTSSTLKKEVDKFKTEKCKVLLYDKKTKDLDILFKGYGLRISNVEINDCEYINVKYCGVIGTPNFTCKL